MKGRKVYKLMKYMQRFTTGTSNSIGAILNEKKQTYRGYCIHQITNIVFKYIITILNIFIIIKLFLNIT